jgi:hypothetical protein
MRRIIHRHVIALSVSLGFSLAFLALSVQARSEDTGRETIIQGVRDDIRRKIQEDNPQPAETAEQAARQQQAAPTPQPPDPKQEPAK